MREMQEEMVSLRRVKEAHRDVLQRSQKLERENAELRRGGGGEGGGGADHPGGSSGRASSDADALLAAAQAEAADTALALAETRDALIAQRKELDAAREDAARAIAAAAGGGGAEAATEAELRRTRRGKRRFTSRARRARSRLFRRGDGHETRLPRTGGRAREVRGAPQAIRRAARGAFHANLAGERVA